MAKETVELTIEEWETLLGILNKVDYEVPDEECGEDCNCNESIEECDCEEICDDCKKEVVELEVDEWEAIQEVFADMKKDLEETEEALEQVVKDVENSKSFDEKIEETLVQEGRIIYLHDEIDEDLGDNIIPLIHYFNEKDKNIKPEEREKITLMINSPGGCMYTSLYIAQEIRNSITPIVGVVNGKAFSGALLIFMACKERKLGCFGQLMFHEVRSNGFGGTAQEISRSVDYAGRLQKYYDQLMMEDTKITQEQLDEHKGKISDWFIDKEEAIELGIVKE